MSRLKYALIGCGRRGKVHLEIATALKDTFQIVAVCDAHYESAENEATKVGAKPYSDVRQMVEREKPDICDVVVPVELHHIVSCYLSECGIHHNVETGLAPTLGLMDLMINKAKTNNIKLQTSENFPFVPVEQFVCHLIQSGTIGKVHKCYRLFSTMGYHGLAAMRCRMGAKPIAVSSISHTMPVIPYSDSAKRNFDTERLEFYTVDFDNGGIGVAMVGNKNGCLGRNTLVGFETCGERGTIVTNGNQSTTGNETINVCTDDDINQHTAKAKTYPFQREYSKKNILQRIYVELPKSLGGIIEWHNPYLGTKILEKNISLATMLTGIARAVQEDQDPLWTGEMGREDQEMIIAAHRSIQMNRQPIKLPISIDRSEEERFDQQFTQRFGVHPREDLNQALTVNFKAR